MSKEQQQSVGQTDSQSAQTLPAGMVPVQQVSVAPIAVASGERGLVLRGLDEMFRFAKFLAASNLAPSDYKGKPENCLIAIQTGAELGLPPMQAIQSIAVINGRPCLWGDTPLALCMSSGMFDHKHHVEEQVGKAGTDTYGYACTYARKGSKPKVSTFTVADAKKAGLWGKAGTWQFYPDRMLLCRARAFGLRNTYPDVLRGVSIKEEWADVEVVSETKSAAASSRVENMVKQLTNKGIPESLAGQLITSLTAPKEEPQVQAVESEVADADGESEA